MAWRVELMAAGIAVGTYNLRRHYLRRFAATCPSPADATRELLLAWLARETWSPETRKSARQSLVTFYAWAHRTGRLPGDNPARDLPRVHVPPPDPRPAADDDVRAALRGASERDWLAVLLEAVGGLRRAEVAQTHAADLRGNWLTVRGKGGRQRTVYLPEQVASVYRRRGREFPNGWIFPNGRGGPMLPDSIGRRVTKRLPEGVTPHQLRHLAASELHDRGATTLEIRAFLGHASVATTQRYVAIRPHRVAALSDVAVRRFA